MTAARIWGEGMGVQVQTTEQAARLFAAMARSAGVRGSDLNAGMWILYSQLAEGRESVVEKAVQSPAYLAWILKMNLLWCRTMSATLAPLLEGDLLSAWGEGQVVESTPCRAGKVPVVRYGSRGMTGCGGS